MKNTTINIEEAIQTINKQNKRIEELCLEIERLNNIINEIKKYCIDEKEDLISGCEVCEDILKMIDKLKEKYLNVVADDDLEYVKKLQQENKQLQQQRKKQKEVIDKAIEYIRIYRSYQKIDNKDYLKGRDEIGCLDIYQVDELLDILKEVSE